MNTSIITLSQESIVEHSKDVIRPGPDLLRCEWNAAKERCECKPASVHAYLKHLQVHCQESTRKGTFTCLLPRCTVSSGYTVNIKDAETHILNTHMNRAQLVCPVNGCEAAYNRPALLEIHFVEAHQGIVDGHFNLPSNVLIRSWKPIYRPDYAPPPSLPPHVPPGCGIIPPSKGTRKHQPRTPALPTFVEGSSAQLSSPGSAKRRAKMDPELSTTKQAKLKDEPKVIMFNDLPKPDVGETLLLDCILRPVGRRYDVSQPPPYLNPKKYGVRKVPLITSYEAFLLENPDLLDEDERDKQDKTKGTADNPIPEPLSASMAVRPVRNPFATVFAIDDADSP